MYEPVHGSAPDISGMGVANPLAMILSVGMMFKYSFSDDKLSQKIENSVNTVLKKGFRTSDIMSQNMNEISTSEMGDLILEELQI